jgi:hypothetical protein
MFYGQCDKCGERWELGTASTCTCSQVTVGASAAFVMTDEELLQQALTALMTCGEVYRHDGEDLVSVPTYDDEKVNAAISALSNRLKEG